MRRLFIPTRSKPEADSALRKLILASLDDSKAEEVAFVDLSGKTSFADAMVIANGRSQRHVGSIADNVAKALREYGMQHVTIEGKETCNWVLIDGGDIIVHVFRPEFREMYNLEKMWSVALPQQEMAL